MKKVKKLHRKLTIQYEVTPKCIIISQGKSEEVKEANEGKHKEKNAEYIGGSSRRAVKLWKYLSRIA